MPRERSTSGLGTEHEIWLNLPKRFMKCANNLSLVKRHGPENTMPPVPNGGRDIKTTFVHNGVIHCVSKKFPPLNSL